MGRVQGQPLDVSGSGRTDGRRSRREPSWNLLETGCSRRGQGLALDVYRTALSLATKA